MTTDNRTNEPTPTPTAVCDVIAETIRLVDGSHSMGAGELGEHIEATLRDRGLLVQEPDEDTVERAARAAYEAMWPSADRTLETETAKQRLRAGVRAALAAAGVSPQEPDAVEGNAKLLQNSGPSEAQVEAAAKAMHERDLAKSEELYPNRPSMWAKLRPAYYEHARAALTAAQGAAPQAEALPETGNELRDEDGDLISSGKHLRILQQGMYVCDTCTNVIGLNVRWDHAVKRDDHAPVLRSSGVDEEKLARVIREAEQSWHLSDEKEQQSYACGALDLKSQYIARAVAEWLGGGAR